MTDECTWPIGLEPHPFTVDDLEPIEDIKLELFDGVLFEDSRRRLILGALLSNVGLREVVHMAPRELWMTALPGVWAPPSDFDLIKELNGQAGRLVTLIGLLFAATTFSIANGPVSDKVEKGADGGYMVDVSLVVVAVGLIWGVIIGVAAMQPAIPSAHEEVDAWRKMVGDKQRRCKETHLCIFTVILGLMAAWTSAYAERMPQPLGQLLAVVMTCLAVLCFGVLLWRRLSRLRSRYSPIGSD